VVVVGGLVLDTITKEFENWMPICTQHLVQPSALHDNSYPECKSILKCQIWELDIMQEIA
jgi:hypothetical protein